jgi:TRAP-type uncharacterized transport system fused permease subunit
MHRLAWLLKVEGQKRTLSGPFALAFSLSAAGFSLWYLYTSGFGLVSTETNRGLYLMLTSVLVFLLYPARAGAPTTRPSAVDLVLIALTVASIGYWIDQYVSYAMFRVSSPSSWDLTMGLIAIAVVLETRRWPWRSRRGGRVGAARSMGMSAKYPEKYSHGALGWSRRELGCSIAFAG